MRKLITVLALCITAIHCSHKQHSLPEGLKNTNVCTNLSDTLVYKYNENLKSDVLVPKERNLYSDKNLKSSGNTIKAVIEIPSGCQDKWIFGKDYLFWAKTNGKFHTTQYLPYITNYGVIPNTLMPESEDGENEEIDIVILGPSLPRGAIVDVYIVGLIKLIDKGKKDDKVLAIYKNPHGMGAFSPFTTIENLEKKGILTIIKTWFENYKGKNKIHITQFENERVAKDLIKEAQQYFNENIKEMPRK